MQSRRIPCALLALALAASGCMIPRWPVAAPVTSPFGLRTIGWRLDLHRGVDLAAPAGSPVRAMAGGRVQHAGPLGDLGQAIILVHGHDVVSVYGHLAEVSVRAGESVGGGSLIGRTGRTGNAQGAHLHFEVRRRGRPVDPVPFLGSFPSVRK